MNEQIIGDYRYFPKRIGYGSYSSVYKGTHIKSGEVVALKVIDLCNSQFKENNTAHELLMNEIRILRSLYHENIIKCYTVIEDKDKDCIVLVLEYCDNGDLENFLNKRPLKEKHAQKLMKMLASGIKYLNSKNILHRDLKPQNILVTQDGILKITDFGFSKTIDTEQNLINTMCGSPLYMAPEIMTDDTYNNKVDLWSIGIILYVMLTGKHPYNAKTHYQLIHQIQKNKIIFPSNICISNDCEDLIYGLLEKDPNERISWDEFFNHSWLNDNYIVELSTSSSSSSENSPTPPSKNIPIPGKKVNDKRPMISDSPMFLDAHSHIDDYILLESPPNNWWFENSNRPPPQNVINNMKNCIDYSFYVFKSGMGLFNFKKD